MREPISETVSDFLKTKNKDSDPFMLVVSYLNPHDICDYVDYLNYDNLSESTKKSKADKLADVAQQVEYAKTLGYPSDEFFAKHAPPLPGNFGDTTPRPAGLKGRQKKFKEDEKIWRMHRWIYNRLIEQVDTGMGRVLAALKAQGLDANTIVVYLSDHGEMSAAHGMEQKSAPYGECQKVPFIFSGPGIKKGVADNDTLTMTGIDMLPTLCELAGVAIPETLPGVSLKQTMTEGKPVTRKYIYPSSANWFQVTDGRYKYTLFETDAKGNRMLIDLKNDPSEMINLASDPSHSRIAADMRKNLLDNLRQRNVAIKGNLAD